jgi:hypothetical protein
MSIKSKVLAATATLTLVGGLGAAGALTANAATPSCGHSCIDIFSREFGTHHHPNFVLDVWRQAARVGQPIILFRTSNSDPAEDFTVSNQGTVNDFLAAGLVSPSLALHYGTDQAFEFEYSPNGAGSNLCVGVATTAVNHTPVSLQPCGVSAKTVWVVDSADSITGFYVPLINGSDTNFSHPFVLHYPGNAFPTDIPRPQLNTYNLQKYSDGTVFDNEMWGANFGVLP